MILWTGLLLCQIASAATAPPQVLTEVDRGTVAVNESFVVVYTIPSECQLDSVLQKRNFYASGPSRMEFGKQNPPPAPPPTAARKRLQPVHTPYSRASSGANYYPPPVQSPTYDYSHLNRIGGSAGRFLRLKYVVTAREMGKIILDPVAVICPDWQGKTDQVTVQSMSADADIDEKPVALLGIVSAMPGSPQGAAGQGPLPPSAPLPAMPSPEPPVQRPAGDESSQLSRKLPEAPAPAAPLERYGLVVGAAVMLLAAAGIAFLAFKPAGTPPAPPAAPAAAPPGERKTDPRPLPEASAAANGPGLTSKYELGGILGQGGMGVVFEGQDRALARKVAIKKMHPQIGSDPQARNAFVKEARLIARVSHPYIVGIHEIVEEGGDIYLVLEFVSGSPLSAVLAERSRLPLSECKEMFRYICQALDFAHRQRVLHRDLKPSNIMVDKEGFVKVMDFGLAREAKDTVSRLSNLKDTSGSPAYMAPEQHLGEASQASDVYALGVMLYEMLTGKLPFNGPDFLVQKERRKFLPASALVGDLSPKCDEFLLSALEPDPARRINAALDFFERLRAA